MGAHHELIGLRATANDEVASPLAALALYRHRRRQWTMVIPSDRSADDLVRKWEESGTPFWNPDRGTSDL